MSVTRGVRPANEIVDDISGGHHQCPESEAGSKNRAVILSERSEAKDLRFNPSTFSKKL
jgi:hypothetical protein